MRFEKNIVALKATLQSLGFENGLEDMLRAQMCFQPERFVITARVPKDPDVMDFILQFEMHDSNGYACRHYDAILRKRIPLEDQLVQDVNIRNLDHRMGLIDWNFSKYSLGNREREESIDGIISDLKKLEAAEEGHKIADLLRVKYWPGTAVEELFGGIGTLKGKQEISQRFYFFDGRSQITVEEAYRYLCNRWLEKEMNAKKKQVDQSGNEEAPSVQNSAKKTKLGSRKGRQGK